MSSNKLFINFSTYIKMSNVSSAKYYENNKEACIKDFQRSL